MIDDERAGDTGDPSRGRGIARPYSVSEERWAALGLLIVVVMLTLGQVALNVRFSYWYNAFYNTLQNLDAHGFYVQIALFAGLATLWVLIGTSRGFLSQMLRIRWRRWLDGSLPQALAGSPRLLSAAADRSLDR